MILDSSIIKRLSFIKYLYTSAVEQSKMPAPMSSTSLLTFHDAAELFLYLACEYLDVNKKGNRFMEYWESLSSKVNITQKESMRRLNKARVTLKHEGTLPSELDIESFRATATNFFDENTPLIFNVKFSEISLVDLIQCKEAKKCAENAYKELQEDHLKESLDKSALAFFYLIDDYEKRTKELFGRSPFFFGKSMNFYTSFFMGFRKTGFNEFDKLGKFIDSSQQSITAIQDAMKILSLGIDYRKYSKFRLLTPEIYKDKDGLQTRRIRESIPSKENVRFCIDFVIESAIILQDLDFNIK